MGIFSPLNQFVLYTDFVNEEIQEDYLSWHQPFRHNTFEFLACSQSKIIQSECCIYWICHFNWTVFSSISMSTKLVFESFMTSPGHDSSSFVCVGISVFKYFAMLFSIYQILNFMSYWYYFVYPESVNLYCFH